MTLRQTFRFAYFMKFSNLYELQILTQGYVYHEIRKYEVTLAIFMKKYIFLFYDSAEENKLWKIGPTNRY